MEYITKCAGCGGKIDPGENIWISDICEDDNVVTHPLVDCLIKYIQPEEATLLSSKFIGPQST